MYGIVLALAAAVILGSSTVLARKNLREMTPMNGAYITVLVGTLFLWPIGLLVTELSTINLYGVIIFILAGIITPGVLRPLWFTSIKKVGVSINASIIATYPIYSTFFATLFLGETLSVQNGLGIGCVILGVFLIERNSKNIQDGKKQRYKKSDLIFPFTITVLLAIAQVVRKYGLSVYNEPILGVAIGYLVALVLYTFSFKMIGNQQVFSSLRQNIKLLWKVGVGIAVGWILSFYALSLGSVSVITPLLQTDTLFIILLSYIFLKDLEKISYRLAFSALIIVLGAVLLTIS